MTKEISFLKSSRGKRLERFKSIFKECHKQEEIAFFPFKGGGFLEKSGSPKPNALVLHRSKKGDALASNYAIVHFEDKFYYCRTADHWDFWVNEEGFPKRKRWGMHMGNSRRKQTGCLDVTKKVKEFLLFDKYYE